MNRHVSKSNFLSFINVKVKVLTSNVQNDYTMLFVDRGFSVDVYSLI